MIFFTSFKSNLRGICSIRKVHKIAQKHKVRDADVPLNWKKVSVVLEKYLRGSNLLFNDQEAKKYDGLEYKEQICQYVNTLPS